MSILVVVLLNQCWGISVSLGPQAEDSTKAMNEAHRKYKEEKVVQPAVWATPACTTLYCTLFVGHMHL